MRKSFLKELDQYVRWLNRSKSPVFYRIYTNDQYSRSESKPTKRGYLCCWVCWNDEETGKSKTHWFTGKFQKKDLTRILAILQKSIHSELVASNCLPADVAEFSDIDSLVVRECATPQGKIYHAVLTKFKEGWYSYPYSNTRSTQEQAIWLAKKYLEPLKPFCPDLRVIVEDGGNIDYDKQWEELETKREAS
jgi:hypothetical protein